MTLNFLGTCLHDYNIIEQKSNNTVVLACSICNKHFTFKKWYQKKQSDVNKGDNNDC